MTLPSTNLYLARDGQVNYRNHDRLGYHRLIRGVYGPVPDTTGFDEWRRREVEYAARLQAVMAAYQGAGAVPYGSSAFQVMRVALPERLQDWDNCHILLPTGSGWPHRAGVVVHRRQREIRPTWRLGEVRLLHPVEHWLQLRGATDDELVEVGDGLLRRRRPILTRDALVTALAGLAGQPGYRRVSAALGLVVADTDSLWETRTRLALVRGGLPTPEVNLPVYIHSANQWLHLDLGYRRERVAVEFDGLVHVGDRRQMELDAERRRWLLEEGWYHITVTAGQLRQPEPLVRSVEAALILRRFTVPG